VKRENAATVAVCVALVWLLAWFFTRHDVTPDFGASDSFAVHQLKARQTPLSPLFANATPDGRTPPYPALLCLCLLSLSHTHARDSVQYFVAGSICACLSHVGGVPIDVLKTRLQTDPGRYDGLWDAAVKVTRTEGPAMLLQGLGPTAAGYAIQGA